MKPISTKIYDARLFAIFPFFISAWGLLVIWSSINLGSNLLPGIAALSIGALLGGLIIYFFKPSYTLYFDPEKGLLKLDNKSGEPITLSLENVVDLYERIHLDSNVMGSVFASRLLYTLVVSLGKDEVKYKFQIISNQEECLKNFDLLRYHLLLIKKDKRDSLGN